MNSYLCPNCKTNRSRFNIIEQLARPIKINPHTGEVSNYDTSPESLEAYHVSYQGPDYKIQCGVCGIIEDKHTFIQFAKSHPL